ncbi:hypothetical protein [Tissierella pigra]|uniref:Uncharacterized protein n=1 Tax=Tissierella pigra TaxID=2607614 RepID=A0A6N7XZM3_9FIRM|nr:hypothetical protein [Tissierella pigra]MSU02913.1 hypothetical protein [Tissierella pigra]
METRLERNKRYKKQRRIERVKRIYILILLIFLVLGIEIVNQNIVELNCLENPNIFRFSVETKTLDFFGKSYTIDFKYLINLLKDQFLVF